MTQNVLIGLTLLFSLIAWVWAIVLLSRSSEGAYFFVAGTVMGGLACICTSLIALVASIANRSGILMEKVTVKTGRNWFW